MSQGVNTEVDWMFEEGALDPRIALISRGNAKRRSTPYLQSGDTALHNIAVFLKPLVVNNTRKWFGEADIRVDALVIQGGQDSGPLFAPRTFRFPRVSDGDNLAEAENGLMVYYGKPKHFLVLTVTLARDTKDSDDLANLITKQANRQDVASAIGSMAAAIASPHIAAVQAAMQGAIAFGDVAYRLIRQISPKCLGLYRTNWLAHKDNFGIGRHPSQGSLTIKDFSFAYDVVLDKVNE